MVEGVFRASDITVIESRCIESDLQFSEFGHASNASNIRNFFLISFDNKKLDITAMSDWHTCMEHQKNNVKQGKVYCSSSVQSIR